MDHAWSNEARRKAWKNGGLVLVTISLMVLAAWIFRMGYQLTNESRHAFEFDGSEDMIVVYGVVAVIFGMLYFIYGLTIVIELGLDLFAWLQGKDVENSMNQGKELCIQATATIVSMSMLVWAIYHGCKLATRAPQAGIHNCMCFVIGFTAMPLGFIYFIVGIPFVAEPALSLYDQLLHIVTQSNIHEEKITDPLLVV